MWEKKSINDRPSNENLIDTLFEDMKKMDSVLKRLQREINDTKIETENIPNDMNMMNSVLKRLTREVHDLKSSGDEESKNNS